jgi:hypothetical protein
MRKALIILAKLLFCVLAAFLHIWIPDALRGFVQFILYLDTIFIITITLMWGLQWGFISALVSSIVLDVIKPLFWQEILFFPCFFATAFVTFRFMPLFPAKSSSPRRSTNFDRLFSTMIVLILLSFALCIVISILGGCISTFIISITPSLGDSAFFTPNVTLPQLTTGLHLLFREILIRIPVNIIDRLVSVFVGYGAAWGITSLIDYCKVKMRKEKREKDKGLG